MNEFRHRCIGQRDARRHLRRDPAPRRGRGDGAGRAGLPLHRLGARADRPRHRSRTWCAPPTSTACRRWCACPATRRRRSPPRSTAARRRPRAARLDRRAGRGRGEGDRAIRRPASAASGRAAPPATATASSTIWPTPTPQIVVAVQVETAEGLANVDAIAATEGVDVVFVGPGDLSVSIDALGPAGAGKLAKAIETIIARRAGARQDRPASSAQRPEDVGDGPARAPASSSSPATRCSSAPAPRQRCPRPRCDGAQADR